MSAPPLSLLVMMTAPYPLRRVRPSRTESPVRPAMREVPTLPLFAYSETGGKRTDADGCHHFHRCLLREDARRPSKERELQLDGELRQVGWSSPEAGRRLLGVDVPSVVTTAIACAIVRSGRLLFACARQRLLVRAVCHAERLEHPLACDVFERPAHGVGQRRLLNQRGAARIF